MSSSTPSAPTTDDYANMYSDIGQNYETAFAQDDGLIRFLAHVISRLPPHSQILDLGCGTGNPVATTLSASSHLIHGLDFSPTMIQLSQRAVPTGKFAEGDMRTFSPLTHWPTVASHGGFDAVFSILSLFILSREEIEEMGNKWGKWVKKGGLLCICTIAAEDLRSRKEGGEGYDEDGFCARDIEGKFMGHKVSFTLFSREGWRWLLGKNGFEIVSENTDIYTPPEEADSLVEPHLFLVARKI